MEVEAHLVVSSTAIPKRNAHLFVGTGQATGHSTTNIFVMNADCGNSVVLVQNTLENSSNSTK